jgi:hypothetical protein
MFLRKIKDIRISNKNISITRDANISIEDIENQINQIKYVPYSDQKKPDTENAKLPPFIQVFYFLFFSYLKIPTEEAFWRTYLSWVGEENSSGEVKIDGIVYSSAGLRGRLNRTYPSLIRDLHFLYLLHESNQFEQVDYSMERDYYNGLDLKVKYKSKEAFVSLFVDTSRSRYFKEKKIFRHNNTVITEIEFIVDFKSLTKLGTIYLLNQGHVKLLQDLINDN